MSSPAGTPMNTQLPPISPSAIRELARTSTPSSGRSGMFQSVLDGLGTIGATTAQVFGKNIVATAISSSAGALSGLTAPPAPGGMGTGLATSGAPSMNMNAMVDAAGSQQMELLMVQQKIQNQGIVFNAETNISKTSHETLMAGIRNMKA